MGWDNSEAYDSDANLRLTDIEKNLLELWNNATPAAKESVMILLENSQKESPSKLSREA